MTLGEKIISLRTSHKMSQGDLAEKLDVSRQSVSKWETEASIPELDKLIMMSELFHVTLDELVKSDSAPETSTKETGETQTTYVIQKTEHNPKRIVGFILLGVGLLGMVLGLLFSETLLMLCLCLATYGVIFLVAKKYTGIVCGWFSTLLLCVPVFIMNIPLSIIGTEFNIASITVYISWILFITMTVITIRTIVKSKKNK